MYIIKCDDKTLFDCRIPEYTVINPKCKLEVNTVGEASFTIHHNHPYYGDMKYLKSIFEISDDVGVIFRGRMTRNSLDFNNSKAVDLEGLMAFFNDSIVRPFKFPEDFVDDDKYAEAVGTGNVVEYFLNWLIENHNSQVQEWQRFKLGTVTVADPNNYISRSSENYENTWNTLKSKLFDSTLGGYLCIRYEYNGNFIDYVSDFELTNTQGIEFGKNLLDLKSDFNAEQTYTAMIPIGATVEQEDGSKKSVTIESLPNETIADDIVKTGDTIYSISAVEQFGWIYADPSESTWDDVTEAGNLLNKAVDKMTGTGILLSNDVEFKAADLHFTDSQIQSFRVYRNVKVHSLPHGQEGLQPLLKLDIDLQNPQNTVIGVGKSTMTMTDSNNKNHADVTEKVETVMKDVADNRNQISQTQNFVLEQSSKAYNDATGFFIEVLEDYTKTTDFEQLKNHVETDLDILPGQVDLKFKETNESIQDVNGDMQKKFNEFYKHIQFTGENGIIISMGNGKMSLQLDNDIISFKRGAEQFGWWDGDYFYTGNIVIETDQKAQFGNFAFVPRNDGSLSLIKVGG